MDAAHQKPPSGRSFGRAMDRAAIAFAESIVASISEPEAASVMRRFASRSGEDETAPPPKSQTRVLPLNLHGWF